MIIPRRDKRIGGRRNLEWATFCGWTVVAGWHVVDSEKCGIVERSLQASGLRTGLGALKFGTL